MTPSELHEMLHGLTTYSEAPRELIVGFFEAMRDVRYGHGPTMQAWAFYLQGWKDRDDYPTSGEPK